MIDARRGGGRLLHDWYDALLAARGPCRWWPGRTRLEIIVGAILTQNTAWTNVEKALRVLRGRGLLRWMPLRAAPEELLAELIRPAGAYRQKARKLRAFVDLVEREYGGSLRRMGRSPTERLRVELLATWGIGPETADSILLYAFGRPVFVIDAYTRRVLARHRLVPERAAYEEAQRFMAGSLEPEVPLFNDFHAQLVRVGQSHCRRSVPQCRGCPLETFLPPAGRPDRRA